MARKLTVEITVENDHDADVVSAFFDDFEVEEYDDNGSRRIVPILAVARSVETPTPTGFFVAVVHAIGEDNEGNMSVVARTREALDKKLLEAFNDWNGEERSALSEYEDEYHWNVDEHTLED